MIAWIFSIGFVSWMTPKMEGFLAASQYQTWVYQHVEEHIREKADAQVEDDDQRLQNLVDGLELPIITQLVGAAEEQTREKVEEAKEALVQSVSQELTARIVSATAMVLSAVTAVLICLLVSLILRAVHELPVLGSVSRLIGGVWGFAEGVMVVWVLFIVTTSLTVSELGQTVMISIANNPILRFLYQNNLILAVINQIRNAIGA